MPFKSQAQWRKFFVMQREGQLPRGEADKWAHETRTPFRSLPKKVAKSRSTPRKTGGR